MHYYLLKVIYYELCVHQDDTSNTFELPKYWYRQTLIVTNNDIFQFSVTI